MAAGERSEFGAAAQRSPRARSARAYSGHDGILGFPGFPFPFPKTHFAQPRSGVPALAPCSTMRRRAGGPSAFWLRCFGGGREALRRFGFGASEAGGRPFGVLASVLRWRAGGKSSVKPYCLSTDVAGADKRLIMRRFQAMNKQSPQSAISPPELRGPINLTWRAQISA